MARRPSLIKIKSKAQKKSRSEQYLINRKGFGDEYIFTSKPLTPHISKYLNWYNAMCDVKEAKEYLTTYFANTGRDADIRKLKSVPDKWINTTVCWIARMISQGASVHVETMNFFNDRVRTMLDRDYTKKDDVAESEGNAPKAPKAPVAKPTIQDRMAEQLEVLICELEEKVDEFITNWKPGFAMYTWLQANEVSSVNAKRIHDFYNPQLLEIEDYVEGRLTEGYEGYTKDQLKKLFGFYVMIVEDLELLMNNTKKVRKTRVAKPMSSDKKLKDFKHMDFDNVRKIQSVQPIRLLSAVELWAFNTKYNQLTVFKAKEGGTLDVHRTAIINFDETASMTKKLKAKDVDTVLKEVSNAGKVALRNIMKNIRGSDQKLQERMNENTLLLRVVSK